MGVALRSGEEQTMAGFAEELSQWPRWSQLLATPNEGLSFHSPSLSLTYKVNTPEKAIFLLFISQKSSSLHVSDTIQNKQQTFVS